MEFRAYRENIRVNAPTQTGQFNFDSSWTRGPLDNSTESPGRIGQSFASFLLGLPAASSFVTTRRPMPNSRPPGALFIHDDWKSQSAGSRLNIGLRYEVEGALTERYNRSVKGFDSDFAQPFEAAAQDGLRKLSEQSGQRHT